MAILILKCWRKLQGEEYNEQNSFWVLGDHASIRTTVHVLASFAMCLS